MIGWNGTIYVFFSKSQKSILRYCVNDHSLSPCPNEISNPYLQGEGKVRYLFYHVISLSITSQCTWNSLIVNLLYRLKLIIFINVYRNLFPFAVYCIYLRKCSRVTYDIFLIAEFDFSAD